METSAAGLRLYHCPGTRSLRPLWLLYEIGAPFELVTMPFQRSALGSPAYRAVHPLGRVPSLTHGDVTIFESGAIVEHLCELFPASGLGRPPGDPERALWLQWLWYSETIAVHVGSLLQQARFIAPADRSLATEALEMRRLAKSLGLLAPILANRRYLLGGGFSAADVCVGCSVHFAQDRIDLRQWPRLVDYYQDLRERAAFIRACSLPTIR